MVDIVERLRNQLIAANRAGLSIPGDPAWTIEQCNRTHARTHLNEKVDEWLPELLDTITTLRAENAALRGMVVKLKAFIPHDAIGYAIAGDVDALLEGKTNG